MQQQYREYVKQMNDCYLADCRRYGPNCENAFVPMSFEEWVKPFEQKIYGMMHPEIKGCIQFTFNAIDQADADSKASAWNRYHSFTGFTAAEIPANHIAATWPLNNNYVRF